MAGAPVDVRIVTTGGDRLTELESLQEWLADSPELRGRVTPVESPPPPGMLGPVLEALLVALAPGSVATALATALVTWIRHRTGAVRVEVERPDGTRVRLEADRVRVLTEPQLRAELDRLLAALPTGGATVVPAVGSAPDDAPDPDRTRG